MYKIKQKVLTNSMLILMAVSMMLTTTASATEGIDYWDYSRWMSETEVTYPQSAEIYNNRIYIAERDGLKIFEISNYADPVYESNTHITSHPNDIALNMHSCVIASGDGLRIYDTNGAYPVELAHALHWGGYNAVVINDNNMFAVDPAPGANLDIYSYITPNPTLLGSIATPGSASDVAVVGTIAYVADSGGGLKIYDVSDVSAPAYIGTRSMSDDAIKLAVDTQKNYLYVVAYSAGVVVFDISNPANPVQVDVLAPINRARSITLKGDFAYVSDWEHGVSVYDISNPVESEFVGSLGGGWSFYTGSSNSDYLFLFESNKMHQYKDLANGFAPLAGELDTIGPVADMFESGNYVFMANGTAGISIANCANADMASTVSQFATNRAYDVAKHGHYLYVADGTSGLTILDVSSYSNPVFVKTVNTPGTARGVAILDNSYSTVAVVATGSGGMSLIDISDPEEAYQAYSMDIPYPANDADDVTIFEDHAYFTCDNSVVKVFPGIPNAVAPYITETIETSGASGDIIFTNGKGYLADGWGRVSILNLNYNFVEDYFPVPGYAHDLVQDGEYLYAAMGQAGMAIIKYGHPDYSDVVAMLMTKTDVNCVSVSGNYAFIGCTDLGFAYRQEMPAPLMVTMNGPSTIYGGVNYTWTATVYGGRAPYTYNWTFRPNCSGDGTTVGGKSLLQAMFRRDGCLRLTVTSADGQESVTGRHIIINDLPDIGNTRLGTEKSLGGSISLELELGQNTPNPFNPRTAFNFSLPKDTHVRLDIFDIRGRLVETVADRSFESGRHAIDFDGTHLASGIYYYRLVTNEKTLTKKMTLMK